VEDSLDCRLCHNAWECLPYNVDRHSGYDLWCQKEADRLIYKCSKYGMNDTQMQLCSEDGQF